jgi:uncharacterized heparinase superfamily protein
MADFRLPAALNRPPWLGLLAAGHAARRRVVAEWNGMPLHLMAIAWPRPTGFAAAPRDFRPARPELGRALLRGAFELAGEAVDVGVGGDPWDRACPSRRFALALHRASWLRNLVACGEPGAREALRLTLAWQEVFGGWNGFSWSPEALERRVFNLACAAGPMLETASDADTLALAKILARQARHLAGLSEPADRRAERTAVAAVAGAALDGPAGEGLLRRALPRLERALPETVLADGGHVSRSPEAGMELLFDLLTLDDALVQRGAPPPAELSRAVDRLTAGLRFFTLADGRLACFQGGEACDAARVRAARAHDDPDGAHAPVRLPHSGYQKLAGGGVEVAVDVGPPAQGPFAVGACAQPLALEVVCGRDRLITNSGWSPRAEAAQALRLTDAASTVSFGRSSAGRPLSGFAARELGPRLVGGAANVTVRREEAPGGLWLEASHDGFAAELGLVHERRLYLDVAAGELRGEDRFTPQPGAQARLIPYTLHFHLDPDAAAVVARDHRSVLLRGPSEKGWWLRNDALDVRVEPAVHLQGGRQRPAQQVVLTGHLHADKGGKVRWKLTAAEP